MSAHALLIGVSRFGDPQLAGLQAPQSDVEALVTVLADPARGGFDEVVTSIDEDLLTIRDKVTSLLEDRHPRDMVLLYYSGHGIVDQANCLFLATGQTSAEKPRARSLPAAEIREMMEHSRAGRLVVVLDCCHSGVFAEGAKGFLAPVNERTFDAGEGAEGQYVLTATNALQYAFDAQGALHRAGPAQPALSRFTSWLVDGLGCGEAAPDKPLITLDDLYAYLCRRARDAGATMTPQRLVKRNSGEMVIARNPAAQPATIPGELLARLDSDDWKVRLEAVTGLKDIAKRESLRESVRRALRDRVSSERDRDVSEAMIACLTALEGKPAPLPEPNPRPSESSSSPSPASGPRPLPVLAQGKPALLPEPNPHPSESFISPSPASGPRPLLRGWLAAAGTIIIVFGGFWVYALKHWTASNIETPSPSPPVSSAPNTPVSSAPNPPVSLEVRFTEEAQCVADAGQYLVVVSGSASGPPDAAYGLGASIHFANDVTQRVPITCSDWPAGGEGKKDLVLMECFHRPGAPSSTNWQMRTTVYTNQGIIQGSPPAKVELLWFKDKEMRYGAETPLSCN